MGVSLLREVLAGLITRLDTPPLSDRHHPASAIAHPGRGRTKTGQFFAYARDDRPFGGDDPPAVAYIYAPDRKAVRPAEHLQGLNGILQADGYSGYKALAEKGQVRLAFCWAHVRRRFYELAANGPAPIATEVLKRIAALYQIETTIRGRSSDQRREVRQEKSLPLLDALEAFLREKLALISQSEAVNVDRGP